MLYLMQLSILSLTATLMGTKWPLGLCGEQGCLEDQGSIEYHDTAVQAHLACKYSNIFNLQFLMVTPICCAIFATLSLPRG